MSIVDLLQPVRALRLRYLPLLMVYFAYGALGVIDVTRDVWVKEALTLSPAELAAIGVWLTLPWTIKVVFGELVDSVAIFGSRRRAYILIGAASPDLAKAFLQEFKTPLAHEAIRKVGLEPLSN